MLDVDATHVSLHGAQEKAYFQRYYDNYCYLPLYVFAGQDLLVCVLRHVRGVQLCGANLGSPATGDCSAGA